MTDAELSKLIDPEKYPELAGILGLTDRYRRDDLLVLKDAAGPVAIDAIVVPAGDVKIAGDQLREAIKARTQEVVEVVMALAPTLVEWHEGRDMQACFVYCNHCKARGGPEWTWSQYGKPKHKPDCKLRKLLDLVKRLKVEGW